VALQHNGGQALVDGLLELRAELLQTSSLAAVLDVEVALVRYGAEFMPPQVLEDVVQQARVRAESFATGLESDAAERYFEHLTRLGLPPAVVSVPGTPSTVGDDSRLLSTAADTD